MPDEQAPAGAVPPASPPEPSLPLPPMDPNDYMAIQLLQQGMKNVVEAQANKERDFLAYQAAMLAGDNIVYQDLKQKEQVT